MIFSARSTGVAGYLMDNQAGSYRRELNIPLSRADSRNFTGCAVGRFPGRFTLWVTGGLSGTIPVKL
jgi:hypothetical protein